MRNTPTSPDEVNFIRALVAVQLVAFGIAANTVTSSPTREKPIARVLVMAPEGPHFRFRRGLVQPAVELALSRLRRDDVMSRFDFRVTYSDSPCTREAAVRIVSACVTSPTLFTGSNCTLRSPTVFLGPVCNSPAAFIAGFASLCNIPVISPGAPAGWIGPGGEKYPTFTRTAPPNLDAAYFLRELFMTQSYRMHWIQLVYEDAYYGESTERECYFLIQSIYAVLVQEDLPFPSITTLRFTAEDIQNPAAFVRKLGRPKITVLCATSGAVRGVMMIAQSAGLTKKERNKWFTIDLRGMPRYYDSPWKRGDGLDHRAKSAYRNLLVVTFRGRQQQIGGELAASLRANTSNVSSGAEINLYVQDFYNSLILYMIAAKATLRSNESLLNGRAVTRNMRNVTFQGISETVSIDEFGDRFGDYSILAMTDFKRGNFEPILEYASRTKKIKEFNSSAYFRVNDYDLMRQIQMHKTWWKGQPADFSSNQELVALGASILGVLACILVVSIPLCCRPKCPTSRGRRRARAESGGGVGSNSAGGARGASSRFLTREEVSVSTCMSAYDEDASSPASSTRSPRPTAFRTTTPSDSSGVFV